MYFIIVYYVCVRTVHLCEPLWLCAVQGAVKDKEVPVEGVQFFLHRQDSQQVGLLLWEYFVCYVCACV